MLSIVELLYVQSVILELNNRPFIVVNITVVGSRKDGDHRREVRPPLPSVHLIPIQLRFMSSNDTYQVIGIQKLPNSIVPIEIGTASHIVISEHMVTNAIIIIHWV